MSGSGMLDKVAGINTAYQLTLWAPLLFNLCYAPLVFSLARTMTEDKRVPWIATWLFFSVSWVGQDYFSPQGVNFIFFLKRDIEIAGIENLAKFDLHRSQYFVLIKVRTDSLPDFSEKLVLFRAAVCFMHYDIIFKRERNLQCQPDQQAQI